jgi:hypothetical protein
MVVLFRKFYKGCHGNTLLPYSLQVEVHPLACLAVVKTPQYFSVCRSYLQLFLSHLRRLLVSLEVKVVT